MTGEAWEHLLITAAVTGGVGLVAAWIGRGYWERRKRDDQALLAPEKLKEWVRTTLAGEIKEWAREVMPTEVREWARATFVTLAACQSCQGHQAAEDGHVVDELRQFKREVVRRLSDIERWMRGDRPLDPSALRRAGDGADVDPAEMRTRGGIRQKGEP